MTETTGILDLEDCPRSAFARFAVQGGGYMKRFSILKRSGNEPYCTNGLSLPIKIMQCSRLHCQKVSNRNIFPVRLGFGVRGVGCGVWGGGCGVWGVGCGGWGVGGGVGWVGGGAWGVGVWGVGCGVWGVGCGVWVVRRGVWGVGCGVWGLGFRDCGLGFRD